MQGGDILRTEAQVHVTTLGKPKLAPHEHSVSAKERTEYREAPRTTVRGTDRLSLNSGAAEPISARIRPRAANTKLVSVKATP